MATNPFAGILQNPTSLTRSSTQDPQAGWRPPQWNKPATVVVTVPSQAIYATQTSFDTTDNGTTRDNISVDSVDTGNVTQAVSYVFDAVLSLEHDQSVTKTRHPVQSGSAISSHAYMEPASLTMYVLMSDAAVQYTPANQKTSPYVQTWTGNPSKSVAAYQQMLTLQSQFVLLTISTRLRTYTNMLITRVTPREDDKTTTSARFRLEFEEIPLASIVTKGASVRPNDTDATGLGSVSSQTPSQATTQQFGMEGTGLKKIDVPGAGDQSSVNVNSLQQSPDLTVPDGLEGEEVW